MAQLAGTLTEAAEKVLGHKVVIKRFMVTVWGRTGYLLPEQESAPLIGQISFQPDLTLCCAASRTEIVLKAAI